MTRFFISYARKGGLEIADELADKLRILGHEVFLDVHTIPGGAEWREELTKRIRWANTVLVLVTPESNRSAAVYAEITEANRLKKTILPIQVGSAELPVHLANKHAVHLADANLDSVLLQIERTLKNRPKRAFPYRIAISGAIILIIILGLFAAKDEIRSRLILALLPPYKEFSVVDQRELLGEVTTEKTQPVDNTQGANDLSQDIQARRQFRYQIDLRLNESSGLSSKDVEDRIQETYDIVGEIGEQLCLIPADVPAGHSYLYNLEWTKVLREGIVETGSSPGSGEILGTYKIVVDLQCQVTGVEVLQ